MQSLRRPLILFLTFLLGCLAADAAPAGAPPPPEVYGTKDLGRVQTNPIISGRDGAYSTRVGGVSVWVYGDTALTSPGADGGTWRHNTLSWTHDLYAPDRLSGSPTTPTPSAFRPLFSRSPRTRSTTTRDTTATIARSSPATTSTACGRARFSSTRKAGGFSSPTRRCFSGPGRGISRAWGPGSPSDR